MVEITGVSKASIEGKSRTSAVNAEPELIVAETVCGARAFNKEQGFFACFGDSVPRLQPQVVCASPSLSIVME